MSRSIGHSKYTRMKQLLYRWCVRCKDFAPDLVAATFEETTETDPLKRSANSVKEKIKELEEAEGAEQ